MSIMVKSSSGQDVAVTGKGQGVYNTVAGSLGLAAFAGSGILGNVLGGGLGGNQTCVVDKDTYYNDRIADIKENNAQMTAVYNEICGLKERASVSETTNYFQNEIVKMGMAAIDNRFLTERVISGYEVDAKTCGMIKGMNVITPSQIGSTYVNPVNVLDQHEARIYDRGFGGCDPCGGYRGF